MDILAMGEYSKGFTLRTCLRKTTEKRVSTVEKRHLIGEERSEPPKVEEEEAEKLCQDKTKTSRTT
jgi:hypothetical protein